jgi:Cell Wall Hydrolase
MPETNQTVAISTRYSRYVNTRGHTALIRALTAAIILVAGPSASAQWDVSLRSAFNPITRLSHIDELKATPTQKWQIEAINAVVPVRPELAIAAPEFSLSAVGADSLTRASAIDCMTAAIYYEAANEPVTGQRAVAQVILNRVRHPAFPDTVCGVVFQGSERATGCQFTFSCDSSLARNPSKGLWLRAQSVAAAALSGLVETSVGHATHYHASYVLPYWAPKLTKLTKIGSHIFYQWNGNWSRPSAFTDHYTFNEVMPLNARTALAGYLFAIAPIAPDPLLDIETRSSLGSINLAAVRPSGKSLSTPEDPLSKMAALPVTSVTVRRSQMIESGPRLKETSEQALVAARGTLLD